MRKVKQVRILLIVVLLALTSVLVTSCYPDYGLTVQDFDIVSTFKDDAVDFQAYSTYYMPDSVTKINEGGIIEPNNGTNDQLILDEIAKQMTAYGYTRVLLEENASLSLYPAVSSTTTWTYYYGYWGGYYGWYYPYYGGYSYSYTTGTLVLTMVDKDKFDEVNKVTGGIWVGFLNGVLNYDTNAELRVRIVDGIAKMFSQSPYLRIYP